MGTPSTSQSAPAVVITGIAMGSALGADVPTHWQRLQQGETAIALRQPFLDFTPVPLAMRGKYPATVAGLLTPAIAAVLADAGLTLPLPDCGVVLGSSRSHQGQWEQLRRSWRGLEASSPSPPVPPAIAPTLETWLQTLPHQPAIAVAQVLQAQGMVLAPMAACATGLWAIAQGYELIQTGQCERVVVGAVEAPITPLTLAGFERMGALAQTGCYPFDRDREGLVLGEGVALLMLETAAAAAARGQAAYAQVLGVGLAADGHHVSAPDPTLRAGLTAIQHCLQRSQLTPAAIDLIHAHGTSTRLNDRQEAALIAALFPPTVPIIGTKGAIGHTLGASGALGLAVCCLALQHQQLPPCVGLREPDPAIAPLAWVRQVTTARLQTALCLSFGFGGQNAAVAIALPPSGIKPRDPIRLPVAKPSKMKPEP